MHVYFLLFFCVNWDVICLQLIFQSAYLICVCCSEWSSQFQVRKFWNLLRYLVLWWLVLVQRGNLKCSGDDNTFCSQKISTILEGGIENFDEANISTLLQSSISWPHSCILSIPLEWRGKGCYHCFISTVHCILSFLQMWDFDAFPFKNIRMPVEYAF